MMSRRRLVVTWASFLSPHLPPSRGCVLSRLLPFHIAVTAQKPAASRAGAPTDRRRSRGLPAEEIHREGRRDHRVLQHVEVPAGHELADGSEPGADQDQHHGGEAVLAGPASRRATAIMRRAGRRPPLPAPSRRRPVGCQRLVDRRRAGPPPGCTREREQQARLLRIRRLARASFRRLPPAHRGRCPPAG